MNKKEILDILEYALLDRDMSYSVRCSLEYVVRKLRLSSTGEKESDSVQL